VELLDGDALTYTTDEPFDAVHCRLVLIHQPTPQEFVTHMVALTRPGGRVAVQDVDADGPTGAPTLLCHPPFPALERLGTAYLAASLRRGSDSQAGRKVLDRFRQAGLAELRTEAQAAFVPVTDPRAATMLDVFARGGAAEDAERFGVMAAVDYTSLLAEVQRARHDPVLDACLVRLLDCRGDGGYQTGAVITLQYRGTPSIDSTITELLVSRRYVVPPKCVRCP
jgi:SAM-dependent methyltransferase